MFPVLITVKYDRYQAGQEFKQKPLKKALDIVILVSQKEAQKKYMNKSVNKFLNLLHSMLKTKKKMNIKYAVVGFGGAGVAEEAHVKSYNKEAFGTLKNALNIIKSMKFDGEEQTTNDAYMAISEAAGLPFRAGSSKLFVLFNANKHEAHKLGSSIDEAKYALAKEVEAALVTFQDVDFKQTGRNKVVGQSTRRLYTHKSSVPGKFTLPNSDYSEMVEDSQGGIFDKDLKNEMKAAKAVYDITNQKIKENNGKCKICKVVSSPWDGSAKAVCESVSC